MKDTHVTGDVVTSCAKIIELSKQFKADKLEALDQFSIDIKHIQKVFFENNVSKFGHCWSEEVDMDGAVVEFYCSMFWCPYTGMIRYYFSEDEDSQGLLGCNMEIRLECLEKLSLFLHDGEKNLLELLED